MMKPYSIRDLRSAFKTDEFRRLGGDYDYTTRRWRFATAAQAIDAGKLASSLGDLITLHDPDAVRHADAIRVRGGFSVVAHNDEGKNKRGTGFYIFANEDDRFEASRYLFEHTRADSAMIAGLRAALHDAPEDLLGPEPTSTILETTLAARPKIEEIERLTARATAARNTRPATSSVAKDSRREVFERAAITVEAMHFPRFEEVPAPANGRVVGILVGRSAHHLAVRTHEDGRGVILDRSKIATPLRQGAVERAFDERAAFGVDLKTATAPHSKFGEPSRTSTSAYSGCRSPLQRGTRVSYRSCNSRISNAARTTSRTSSLPTKHSARRLTRARTESWEATRTSVLRTFTKHSPQHP